MDDELLVTGTTTDALVADVEALLAEVERLRAALERISTAIDVYAISGEEGCRPSLGWIGQRCAEALEGTNPHSS